MTINIAVIEDDATLRAGLIHRIEQSGEFSVVADTGSVVSALEVVETQTPDVLLVDLQLEDGSGIDVIQAVAETNAYSLVISVFGDEASVVQALEAGADGYLLKDDPSSNVEAAIKQLLQGGAPLSPQIARHLLSRFRPEDVALEELRPELSGRERDVLNLAARGYTYQESAELLDVSLNTISSYTRRVYRKLSASSRAEAVFEAQRLGLMQTKPNNPE